MQGNGSPPVIKVTELFSELLGEQRGRSDMLHNQRAAITKRSFRHAILARAIF
jgi:hypothetical protein